MKTDDEIGENFLLTKISAYTVYISHRICMCATVRVNITTKINGEIFATGVTTYLVAKLHYRQFTTSGGW